MASTASSNNKPLVAVCGARGNQGSNVIKALLAKDVFSIRAITRHPSTSAEAKGLAELGVEVVQADYDKPDTMAKAFKGCHAVFGVTDWYEAGEREIQQGRNLVDAAKLNGVKHFVWSSGEETKGVISSYSTKAATAKYLIASGVPYTCIKVPVYFDTLLVVLERVPTGGWVMNAGFPNDAAIPFVSPVDVGKWVASVLTDPGEWMNQSISPCTEWLYTDEMSQIMLETTGEGCVMPPITTAQFLAFEPTEPSLHNEKTIMEHFLGSYARKEFSTTIGHQLSPQPRMWRNICEDMTIIKSPIEENMGFPQLDIEVIQDCEETFQ